MFRASNSGVLVLRGYGRYFGEETFVRFDGPWEFVELCEQRNSEVIVSPNSSVFPQCSDGSGFVESTRSWPLLE